LEGIIWFMRRLAVHALSGISLLVFLVLGWFWLGNKGYSKHLTLRREAVTGNAHKLFLWDVDFGSVLELSHTRFEEDHLLPEQVAELAKTIPQRPRVEWTVRTPQDFAYSYPAYGRFTERWDGGSVQNGVRLPYGLVLLLAAVVPAAMFLRESLLLIGRLKRDRPRRSPRPLGRIGTVAAAMSLLTLIVVSAAWVQSEIAGFTFHRYSHPQSTPQGGQFASVFIIASNPGAVHFVSGPHAMATDDPEPTSYFVWEGDFLDMGSVTPLHGIEDVLAVRWSNSATLEYQFDIAYWLLCALALPLPLYWLARRKGWIGGRKAGLCVRCGYDLRASESVCPECGTPIGGHEKLTAKCAGMNARTDCETASGGTA
jgi:hypothetical protein